MESMYEKYYRGRVYKPKVPISTLVNLREVESKECGLDLDNDLYLAINEEMDNYIVAGHEIFETCWGGSEKILPYYNTTIGLVRVIDKQSNRIKYMLSNDNTRIYLSDILYMSPNIISLTHEDVRQPVESKSESKIIGTGLLGLVVVTFEEDNSPEIKVYRYSDIGTEYEILCRLKMEGIDGDQINDGFIEAVLDGAKHKLSDLLVLNERTRNLCLPSLLDGNTKINRSQGILATAHPVLPSQARSIMWYSKKSESKWQETLTIPLYPYGVYLRITSMSEGYVEEIEHLDIPVNVNFILDCNGTFVILGNRGANKAIITTKLNTVYIRYMDYTGPKMMPLKNLGKYILYKTGYIKFLHPSIIKESEDFLKKKDFDDEDELVDSLLNTAILWMNKDDFCITVEGYVVVFETYKIKEMANQDNKCLTKHKRDIESFNLKSKMAGLNAHINDLGIVDRWEGTLELPEFEFISGLSEPNKWGSKSMLSLAYNRHRIYWMYKTDEVFLGATQRILDLRIKAEDFVNLDDTTIKDYVGLAQYSVTDMNRDNAVELMNKAMIVTICNETEDTLMLIGTESEFKDNDSLESQTVQSLLEGLSKTACSNIVGSYQKIIGDKISNPYSPVKFERYFDIDEYSEWLKRNMPYSVDEPTRMLLITMMCNFIDPNDYDKAIILMP